MGNALKPLAKRVLTALGLTAGALATDAAIHKKLMWSGVKNEEMNDVMKTIKSLDESVLLIKSIS